MADMLEYSHMETENWLPIPGYESRYEVSDLGRVRVCGIDAIGRRRRQGHVMAGRSRNGYPSVVLHLNRVWKNFSIHRLVMLTFVGPCPENHNVNHKDGNKANPRLDNLEYSTQSENYRHALSTLKFQPPRGAKHWAALLTEEKVREIRSRNAAGELMKDLATEFRIARSAISKIISRDAWKHVI